jgi:hypothetical protein
LIYLHETKLPAVGGGADAGAGADAAGDIEAVAVVTLVDSHLIGLCSGIVCFVFVCLLLLFGVSCRLLFVIVVVGLWVIVRLLFVVCCFCCCWFLSSVVC